MMLSSLDIIWNISLVCPWNCEFCCTDATYVKRENSKIIYRDNGLQNKVDVVTDDKFFTYFHNTYNRSPDLFDEALYFKQKEGKELTLIHKLEILENLKDFNVSIDFAGGDPLACYENFIVLKRASEIFGKNNISITSTGLINGKYKLEDVAKYIGEYEFTYDEPDNNNICRPRGYNSINLEIASKFAKMGVKTKAQLPLHKANFGIENIRNIISKLSEKNIDELLLMRTFPVGRAFGTRVEMDRDVLKDNIEIYLYYAKQFNLKIRLQCALKHLIPEREGLENPCDLMRESFGINFQGKLLVSAWANDNNGYPISDDFVLGDLTKEEFSEIKETQKFKSYLKRLDDNFGHCKIFSYLNNSTNQHGLFSKTDPLYYSNE